MKNNRNLLIYILLGLVLVIGLSLRLMVFKSVKNDFKLTGDANNYYIMSHQLVDNHVYGYALGKKSGNPNAYVTPGYIVFLSFIYMIFHDIYRQITIARLLQIFAGGFISPLLAFLFIRRLIRKEAAALLTALFTAIYPSYILSSTYLLTEVLSLAGMLLYFYMITIALQGKKAYVNLLAGAVFALDILIRPTMFPLFVMPFVFNFFLKANERKRLLALFAYNVAGFVVLMLPWWARNMVVLHKLVLLSTGSGDPLLAGSYPYMKGLFSHYANSRLTEEQFAKERIISGLINEPLYYLRWYTIGKVRFLFKEPWLYSKEHFKEIFYFLLYKSMPIIHNLFILAGLAGAFVNSVRSRIILFMNIYALMFLALLLIFIPESRYAYQLMFFLMASSSIIICDFVGYLLGKLGKNKIAEI